MLNLKTGEIVLPEIVLCPATTLNEVQNALQENIKAVYRDEAQENTDTIVFFNESPIVTELFELLSLTFNPDNLLIGCTLSPVDVGDDDWGEEAREPVEARLTKMAHEANGKQVTDTHWSYSWGTIEYEHDHLVDVQYIDKGDWLQNQLKAAFQKLDSQLFVALTQYYGEKVHNIPKCALQLPSTTISCLDYENLIYAAQLQHGDKCHTIIADEHHLMEYLYKDDSDPEILVYKKWR